MANYNIDIGNPITQGLQGYALGQQIGLQRQQMAAQQQAAAAAQAKQQQQMELQQKLAAFSARPGKSAQEYISFVEQNPTLYNAIKEPMQIVSEQEKQADILDAGQIMMLAKSGKKDLLMQKLEEQKQAYLNSNKPDQAQFIDMMMTQADMGEEGLRGVGESASFFLATVAPEQLRKNLETLGKERRAEEMQPGEIAKQKADIIKSGMDAGLTQQEALKTQAETRKLDAETQKIIMELAADKKGGNLSTDKKVDLEQKLSDKYYSRNKNYLERLTAYNNLVESAKQDSGQGDFALIVAFNKMLDPASVVRESEFAMAEASSGRMQQLLNFFQKFKEGDRLKPEQRQRFINLAKKYMEEAEKNKELVNAQLNKTIDAYGLNRDIVLPPERSVSGTDLTTSADTPKQPTAEITTENIGNSSVEDIINSLPGQ